MVSQYLRGCRIPPGYAGRPGHLCRLDCRDPTAARTGSGSTPFRGYRSPSFITGSSGILAGVRLETQRGEILRGILEGVSFYIKECIDTLPGTQIIIDEFRAVGGGARSDTWIQLSADIMGKPILRPKNTEAGALGAALIAGAGTGVFSSFEAGVAAMVSIQRVFEPDSRRQVLYDQQYERYKRLWRLMESFWQEQHNPD